MVALMVLDKILLAVKDTVTANDNAWPILARFVHSHLMLLPVRLCFEGLQRLLLSTVSTKHVGLTRLALTLVVSKKGGGCDADIIRRGKVGLRFYIQWAADIRCRR